jgi:hypothetical protein
MLLLIPLDLALGLSKGVYPTQATLAVYIGGGLGVWMWRKLAGPRRTVLVENTDPEVIADTLVNRNLNFGLGTALLGLALVLALFGMVMIATQPGRPLPLGEITPARMVELGFIVLFNLMLAGLEGFAAKIYLMGRARA